MRPLISIIVPVHNGGRFLDRCLDALKQSTNQSYELIVVDDCSSDESVRISREKGATVFSLTEQSGPAVARNFGASKANGEILLFVDADVVVESGTLDRLASDFAAHPGVAAIFGSYDADPAEKNFVSQYKNLFHHFIHQQSNTEAVSFWAGCGAVRLEVFNALGGFDGQRYPRPAIEDIELGYRMRRMGHRILLDKQLRGKHLKQWTLKSLLHADIFCRAIPWSYLILETKGMVNDLNLRTRERLVAFLASLVIVNLLASILVPSLVLLIPLTLGAIALLNHRLYRFFFHSRGLAFAVRAFPLHYLYYLYSGVTFVFCYCLHTLSLHDFPNPPPTLKNNVGDYSRKR